MIRLLQQQHTFSDRFIAHMLARNTRLEEDLIDQLFNASEKRLARTLLLLARFGKPDGPRRVLPTISQEVLAEMVGTTRSRVNVFMNKFRKLGFIEYNAGGLKVHDGLLSVERVLPQDGAQASRVGSSEGLNCRIGSDRLRSAWRATRCVRHRPRHRVGAHRLACAV
jgi:hypothetical protein